MTNQKDKHTPGAADALIRATEWIVDSVMDSVQSQIELPSDFDLELDTKEITRYIQEYALSEIAPDLLAERDRLFNLLRDAWTLLSAYKDKPRYKRSEFYCQLMDDIETALDNSPCNAIALATKKETSHE